MVFKKYGPHPSGNASWEMRWVHGRHQWWVWPCCAKQSLDPQCLWPLESVTAVRWGEAIVRGSASASNKQGLSMSKNLATMQNSPRHKRAIVSGWYLPITQIDYTSIWLVYVSCYKLCSEWVHLALYTEEHTDLYSSSIGCIEYRDSVLGLSKITMAEVFQGHNLFNWYIYLELRKNY